MSTTIHTEYLKVLGAIDRNNTRRLTHHLGRYHGFDTMGAGTGSNIPIKISHTNKCAYINSSNAKVEVAVLVTGHGAVVETDVEPNVEVLANNSGGIRYQVFYASYTWANSPSGSSVTYGTGAVLSVEPETPPTLTNVQVPLGYFTIVDGATDITGVSYTPYPSPNLANKDDIDLSPYAKLAGPNEFTGLNVLSHKTLPKAAVIVHPTQGDPYYQIELGEDGNVFWIEALDSQEYRITDIVFSESRTAKDGELFILRFAPSGGTIKWFSNNLLIPNETFDLTSMTTWAMVGFIRTNGKYEIFTSPTVMKLLHDGLDSRVTSLEAEVREHEGRLDALESAGQDWEYLIDPGTVKGNWVVELEMRSRGGFTYLRGFFYTETDDVSGSLLEIATAELGVDITVAAPAHQLALLAEPFRDPVHIWIEDTNNKVYIKWADLAAFGIGHTRYQYKLPPTIIK